ncbi:hypothetical protein Tsubulata_033428 [Turnera subulata]|uniref:Small ribosomal subunit protein mS38 n=1 Tax=Turnera subulata TaxID=218843 RepID=A0A9Q0JH00_9ROSI|nr:hypothetical protein Tsubulata_033428 [Turnera subulata]
MAISTLHKLFKNSPSPARILASLHNPLLHPQNPTPPSILQHYLDRKPGETNPTNASPFLGSFKADNARQLDPWMFYSISPVGSFLSPVLSTGSVEGGADNDQPGMWADSVKKKRKRKMNKHKYRKLRKRLRRQT